MVKSPAKLRLILLVTFNETKKVVDKEEKRGVLITVKGASLFPVRGWSQVAAGEGLLHPTVPRSLCANDAEMTSMVLT